MKSFREKNSGPTGIWLTHEQLGGEIPMRSSDLKPHVIRKAKEIATAKAGLSEEIKRAHPEFITTQILPEAKETARPSSRRRKFRVYLPR